MSGEVNTEIETILVHSIYLESLCYTASFLKSEKNLLSYFVRAVILFLDKSKTGADNKTCFSYDLL